MILTELTGAIAMFIDGIITSQGLGVDVYSGIALIQPFAGIIMMFAGFFATGCNVICSRLIGVGKKEEANEAFNLSFFLALAAGVLLGVLCLCFPDVTLRICGVSLNKYPELHPHMYGYLHGYLFGIPAIVLSYV